MVTNDVSNVFAFIEVFVALILKCHLHKRMTRRHTKRQKTFSNTKIYERLLNTTLQGQSYEG